MHMRASCLNSHPGGAGPGRALGRAQAQDKGTLEPQAPAAARRSRQIPATPAKELFGRARGRRADFRPDPIGFYSRGCLAGGEALPVNGPDVAGDAAVAQPQLGPSGL